MNFLKKRIGIKYAKDRHQLWRGRWNLKFLVSVGPWHLISWVEVLPMPSINDAREHLKSISQRMPEQLCPCGNKMNRTMDATGSGMGPSEGDISMCAKCGRGYIFGPNMSLREVTDAELEKVKAENPEGYEYFRRAQKFVTSRYTGV